MPISYAYTYAYMPIPNVRMPICLHAYYGDAYAYMPMPIGYAYT